MQSWIISVVSVVILMVLLDLFLIEGSETKKYIKGIMSIIVIAVIIAPLPKLVNRDFNINEVFDKEVPQNEDIQTDEGFLYRYHTAQYKKKELAIQKYLSEKGLKGTVIKININYVENQIEITNVMVSLENAVITETEKNININEMIYQAVTRALQISREKIVIYGKDL